MKQKTGRKLLSFLLALAMVVGLMPGMGLTAQAATYSSGALILIRNANSLAAGDILESGVKLTVLEKAIIVPIYFDGQERNSAVVDSFFSYTTDKKYQVDKLNSEKSVKGGTIIHLYLKTYIESHNVTITGGTNATPSGGAKSQTGLTGAMTIVTFTADNGCQFPATSNYYTTTNGITVARTSATVVTVSGTPTADTAITVPNAVSKTALGNKITEATDYYNGIASGDSYAPVKDMLNTAIDTATGVKNNDDCDQTTVDNAVTALDHALNSAKAIVSVIDQLTNIPESTDVTTGDKDAIEAVGKAYDDLTDEQKEMVDKTQREKLEAAEVALVDDIFEELPNSEDVTTDDQDAIEAARKAYNDLTEDQKKKVSDDTLKKLADAEDALAAAGVSEKLNALPAADKVTTSDKEAIEAARAAYDALTDDQKKYISEETLKKLTDAEDALAAAGVSEKINALPAADTVATSDKEAIEKAREAYDALTDDQKKYISEETLKKLTDAEDALAVAEVTDKINNLPATSEITVNDEDGIEAARDAYEDLTDDQKKYVSQDTLDKLTDAEEKLSNKQVLDAIEKITNLPNASKVKTSDKDAIEAARNAYDALTDDQKESISAKTLKKLTDAENVLAPALVNEMINALPAAKDVSVANKEAIEAARKAYNALTDDQKTKVSEDTLKKLTDAEDALAAAAVSEAIKALPASTAVTAGDKDAIEAAREAYEALNEEEKKRISDEILQKLEDAEEALEEALEEAEKEMADQEAADAVTSLIDALPSKDKVTKDNKTAIDAAKKAFDKLTEDQKKKVSDEDKQKLTDAVETLAAIEKAMNEVSAKTGSDMTYTGKPIQLINTPTTKLPEGYKIVYAVTTEDKTPTDENLYTTSIPTAVDPGTYYVWCDVTEDGNHEAIEPFCIIVEVAVSGIMGDVNGDGIVDIADALMITRYDVELVTLNKNQLALGDITGDGSVDIADALYISRLDAGLLEE